MIKQIPIESENQYFACKCGRIYRLSGNKMVEWKGWLEYSHPSLPKRYWRINVGGKKYYKHRLILTTFDRPPKEGEVARHLDDDEFNNRFENLEWGSHQDNADDKKLKKLNDGWDKEEEAPF